MLENLGQTKPRGLGERVDWGVWAFGTPTYDQILNGTIPTIACELFQRSGRNPASGRLWWYDYVGAIVDEAITGKLPQTEPYVQGRHARPPWIVPEGDDFRAESIPDQPTACDRPKN